jgi:hypothetical protein
MKPRLMAVLALVPSWAILSSPHAAIADPPKEAELLKRIEQLEKRVTELEKAIKEGRPSGKEPATETEKKLVGSWVITDDDMKAAADKKIIPLTDLKMKADGTCGLVVQDHIYANAKYHVTAIGRVTEIDISVGLGDGASIGWNPRIASLTETELVLQYKSDGGWVKVRYTRKK